MAGFLFSRYSSPSAHGAQSPVPLPFLHSVFLWAFETRLLFAHMARDDLFSAGARAEASPESEARPHQPLAARMRPRDLCEFVGQSHILGPGQLLRRAIEADRLQSLHLLRPARHRQDFARPNRRPPNQKQIRAAQRRRIQRGRYAPRPLRRRESPRKHRPDPPSFSWTKSTGSTKPSRTSSCPTLRPEWSA